MYGKTLGLQFTSNKHHFRDGMFDSDKCDSVYLLKASTDEVKFSFRLIFFPPQIIFIHNSARVRRAFDER